MSYSKLMELSSKDQGDKVYVHNKRNINFNFI
jgi:hypothetical protein